MPSRLRSFDPADWQQDDPAIIERRPRPTWFGPADHARHRWQLARYAWLREHGIDPLVQIKMERAERRAVAHLDHGDDGER